jgi:RNA polymerase sigma factor (sigma-70 family)
MATGQLTRLVHHLRRAALLRDGAGLSDAELLGMFLSQRDDAAFEALVRRHGPMVMGVCRRILSNLADAEDAFQATFVVLVRKASSVVPRATVGNWLYGVAYRTALAARRANARRASKEKKVRDMPHPEAGPEATWQDLQPFLDQELSNLPDKYRMPVVLCDLEGRTRKEVARTLGIPDGTLSNRLATAHNIATEASAKDE